MSYRAALGVDASTPLPKRARTTQSAGSARGGKGAAQRGKGRNR